MAKKAPVVTPDVMEARERYGREKVDRITVPEKDVHGIRGARVVVASPAPLGWKQQVVSRMGSQSDLAELMGMSQGGVSKLMGRDDWKISMLERVAKALGCRVRIELEEDR